MNKRKILSFIIILLTFTLTSCGYDKSEEKSSENDVNLRQMQSICELATLECFYHNTAKYSSDKSVLWWNTNKELWVEYEGIVKVGIDLSQLDLKIEDNVVSIKIPNARVLSCKVDETTLTEDSYITKSTGLFASKINANDQTAAFKDAQEKMLETAEADYSLKLQAQQRAQELLEKYVKNVGNALGKQYEIKWEQVSSVN